MGVVLLLLIVYVIVKPLYIYNKLAAQDLEINTNFLNRESDAASDTVRKSAFALLIISSLLSCFRVIVITSCFIK